MKRAGPIYVRFWDESEVQGWKRFDVLMMLGRVS